MKLGTQSKRRRILTVVMCLFLGLLIGGVFGAYGPTRTVHAEGGITDTDTTLIKDDDEKMYQLQTEVVNQGKDFTGYLQILFDSNGSKLVEREISIPEKTQKQVEIDLPYVVIGDDHNMSITVRVVDSEHNPVYQEQVNHLFADTSRYAGVGILSDRSKELGMVDLGGNDFLLMTDYVKFSVQELSAGEVEKNLPKLRYLLIDSYDVSALSPDERAAIEKWTRNGGMLVIGTGAAEDKTYRAFDDVDQAFIGIPSGKLVTKDTDIGNMQYSDMTCYYDVTMPNNYSWADEGIVSKNYNSGSVTFIQFSMTDKEYIDLYYRYMDDYSEDPDAGFYNRIYNLAMNETNYIVTNTEYTIENYEVQNEMEYMEIPTALKLGGIKVALILYLIVLSPILYLILKKIDKKEMVWVIVPAVSILFTFVIFLQSGGMKGFREDYRSLVIESTEGDHEAIFYLSGYHADSTEWSEKLADEVSVAVPFTNEYSWRSQREYATGVRYAADGSYVLASPDETFSRKLYTGRIKDKGGAAGSFTLDVKSNVDMSSMNGSFTNQTGYDFDYVFVFSRGVGACFENVSNNQTVDCASAMNVIQMAYGSRGIESLAETERRSENYEDSCSLFALDIGLKTIYDPNGTFIIGVMRTDDKVLQNSKNENAWKCIYTVME